jgi:hypothetical protein
LSFCTAWDDNVNHGPITVTRLTDGWHVDAQNTSAVEAHFRAFRFCWKSS